MHKTYIKHSELIEEVLKRWDTWLESLSLSGGLDNVVGLGSSFEWVSGHLFPMIEHALWEGSSGGGGSEGLSETEGLSDWEVSLHLHEWGSLDWLLTNDDSSSLGKGLVDWTISIIWGLDLNEVD